MTEQQAEQNLPDLTSSGARPVKPKAPTARGVARKMAHTSSWRASLLYTLRRSGVGAHDRGFTGDTASKSRTRQP
jgi:hypothetical protein